MISLGTVLAAALVMPSTPPTVAGAFLSPVRQSRTSVELRSTGGRNAPATGADLSLAEAIKLAEENSPMLAAARAEAQAASSGARAARAETLPMLSANGFATTGNNSSIISSSPGVEPPAWMMIPTGDILIGNLMLMVPIIAPSRSAMANAANWESRAAQQELAEARAELAMRVTEAYSEVLVSRQMIAAAEAEVKAAQEMVRITQIQFEAGKGIEATVQRVRTELAQAERSLTTARNNEAKALLDLAEVIGIDLKEPLNPTDALALTPVESTLDEFIARAKESRGMTLAAKARLEAARAEVRVAEGLRSPQLYGVAMADGTSRRDMRGGVSAGLTLSFPLFDGGRINAEVGKARSMRAKAEADLRQAELTVEKEVRQAWLDVQTAAANARSAEEAVKAAQAAYEVTALRVEAGKSILVEQLDALEALTMARAEHARALFEHTVAVARLTRSAGGAK